MRCIKIRVTNGCKMPLNVKQDVIFDMEVLKVKDLVQHSGKGRGALVSCGQNRMVGKRGVRVTKIIPHNPCDDCLYGVARGYCLLSAHLLNAKNRCRCFKDKNEGFGAEPVLWRGDPTDWSQRYFKLLHPVFGKVDGLFKGVGKLLYGAKDVERLLGFRAPGRYSAIHHNALGVRLWAVPHPANDQRFQYKKFIGAKGAKQLLERRLKDFSKEKAGYFKGKWALISDWLFLKAPENATRILMGQPLLEVLP